MRYSKEKQKEHMARIRRVLVMNPNASILEIRDILKKLKPKGLSLDKNYINRLVNKISKERTQRIDRMTINKVLAESIDKMTESDLVLWSIVRSSNSNQSERVQALREIRNNNKDLFNMMLDAGVFERKLGELNVKDKNAIKNLDNLPKDVQRKYFAKIAKAEAEIESSQIKGSDSETEE